VLDMTEVLAESEQREREREAARTAARERIAYARPGTDLMRTVHACVSEVARGAKRGRSPVRLSETERDALAATVALAVLESHARQHPGRVLTRASYGRSYVLALTRGAVRERSYRDTLDGWRTRAEVAADRPATVAGSVDSLPADTGESESGESERPAGGWLSHALMRESERTGEEIAPVPADLPAIVGTVARLLAAEHALTPRETGSVYVALMVAAGNTLTTLAAENGAPSLRTLAGRSSDGAKLVRERIGARDLRAAVREAARQRVADYALRLAVSGRADLSEAARCALAAIERVRSTESERAGYRMSAPGPVPAARVRIAATLSATRTPAGTRQYGRQPAPAGYCAPAVRIVRGAGTWSGPVCSLCAARAGRYVAHPSYPEGMHPSVPERHPDSLTAGQPVYVLSRPAATYGPRTSG
jgi:hypothetical protein